MATARERVEQLVNDTVSQLQYTYTVARETTQEQTKEAVFSPNPFKKAGNHVVEALKRVGRTIKSGFNAFCSGAKACWGGVLTAFNIGKYAKHKYDQAKKLNEREEALQKARELREVEVEAAKRGADLAAQVRVIAEAQEALAHVAETEADALQQLASEDAAAVQANASWAIGRTVEAGVDTVYTAAHAVNATAYAASSCWHTVYGAGSTLSAAANAAISSINDYYAGQIVNDVANAMLEAPLLDRVRRDDAAGANPSANAHPKQAQPIVHEFVKHKSVQEPLRLVVVPSAAALAEKDSVTSLSATAA